MLSDNPTRWALFERVAFRFAFLYFGLYCLSTGMVPLAGDLLYSLGTSPPIVGLVEWTAANVFHYTKPLVHSGSGSGDKAFDWIWLFCVLCFSVVGTIAWSLIDRKRPNYATLHKWFRLFLRFAVGTQMISYGLAKAVPMQMPFPYLTRLVQPYGSFSPMGVLWSSVGASPAYESFVGSVELIGGILLLIPRTSLLGVLVCLAAVSEVFVLNMTYDVPVKLLSFHLILMSLFVLRPDLRRLLEAIFTARDKLLDSARANRIASLAQMALLSTIIAVQVFGARSGWYQYGGGAPKSALYGIWNIETFTVNGEVQPPLLTDNDRYRRVIFDLPTFLAFQRMDDSFVFHPSMIDTTAGAITLTKPAAVLRFKREGDDRLIIDGAIDNRTLHLECKLQDRAKFNLINRGFNWVQDYPFNR